jgi:hypothetical protein
MRDAIGLYATDLYAIAFLFMNKVYHIKMWGLQSKVVWGIPSQDECGMQSQDEWCIPSQVKWGIPHST